MHTDGSLDGLVALRRDLHRHPELRFAEVRTARVLAERLQAAGFEVSEGIAGTGLVARSGRPGERPHVIVRADMDAVPTDDPKEVPYASRTPGVAHACGHDVHMAVVVGVGEQLLRRGNAVGRVSLLFQPAEEIPFGEGSGARAMIDGGVLDDTADAILGLHCWPGLPAGTVGVDRSVAMAAKDAFRIRYVGAPAHAATPSRGRDAVLAMSEVVNSLHHVVSRLLDPGERAALNIGTFRGGTSQSIVPAEAEITGTIRTIDAAVRARLREAVERRVAGIAAATGVEPTLEWANEMPAVRNDPALVARALAVVPRALGPDALRVLSDPPMATDDFALYAERVPGLYLKLGVCPPDASGCPSLHDGRFDVDERSIGTGVEAITAIVRDLLEPAPASGGGGYG